MIEEPDSEAERKEATWWSSRHRNRVGGTRTLRANRRLTLIDLLLLVVMTGVLFPWLVSRGSVLEVDPYRIRFTERGPADNRVLAMRIVLPENESPREGELVGWQIFDLSQSLLAEEYDLAPAPGDLREFFYRIGETEPVRCVIHTGDATTVHQLTMGKR